VCTALWPLPLLPLAFQPIQLSFAARFSNWNWSGGTRRSFSVLERAHSSPLFLPVTCSAPSLLSRPLSLSIYLSLSLFPNGNNRFSWYLFVVLVLNICVLRLRHGAVAETVQSCQARAGQRQGSGSAATGQGLGRAGQPKKRNSNSVGKLGKVLSELQLYSHFTASHSTLHTPHSPAVVVVVGRVGTERVSHISLASLQFRLCPHSHCHCHCHCHSHCHCHCHCQSLTD
jgi:hypothetical protein